MKRLSAGVELVKVFDKPLQPAVFLTEKEDQTRPP
jgi:hypothetical protein